MNEMISLFKKTGTVPEGKASSAPETEQQLAKEHEDDQIRRWGESRRTGDLSYKFKLLKELAEEGFSAAIHDLGSMYMNGEYVDEDWDKARELFLDCYEEIPCAALWIGMMGVHPEKFREQREDQLAEAFYFLSVAAGNGIDEAFPIIDHWWHRLDKYGDRNWIATHFRDHLSEILEELEKQKDGKAMDTLGLFYQFGLYYEQDLARAKEYFEKAAALGRVSARNHLRNPIFDLVDDDEE